MRDEKGLVIAKPTVVIHTNDQQLVAAKVSAHSLKARSKHRDRFDVRIFRLEEVPELTRHEGEKFLWWEGSKSATWRKNDLQSFQLLRRMVPALLGYAGRALVIDPDVFAVGDVYELLSRDMGGKAILCRERPYRRDGQTLYSSAVMLLDCAQLGRWDPEREIEGLFSGQLHMGPLLSLLDVPPEDIGLFEKEWNDLDTLTSRTKLVHTTDVATQPWRTGLPTDHRGQVRRLPRWLAWSYLQTAYVLSGGRRKPLFPRRHPDPHQERLFLTLLDECLKTGEIKVDFLEDAVRKRHLRRDVLKRLRELE